VEGRASRPSRQGQDRGADRPFGNPGDVEPVGEGISELRVHVGPGCRIYFVRQRRTIVVLLCGGDKSTQTKDIKTAKVLAANLED
jgi:putative addiction module killer protein